MPSVAAVRLAYNPKVLWFDPNGVEFSSGDALIVKTERGLEYGVADEDLKEVSDEAILKLRSSLKPVIRRASQQDSEKWSGLQKQAAEALPVFKEMVEEYQLDMRPVTVEFLFDGDKAIFYFEADERVDFRELVRSLASRFHMRIDMRQIGVRDEARIVGGYGHCGQELCCARMGGHFNPVSIRMAKDQDLSLNPQKISGLCGRLMCCLRYEADAYKEFKCHCPKQGSSVKIPKGEAKVVEINVPRETVTLQVEDKRVRVPVAEMGVDKKTGKPNSVSGEVLERCMDDSGSGARIADVIDRSIFTGTDKLAGTPVARHIESSRGNHASGDEAETKPSARRRRRSRGSSKQDEQASAQRSGAASRDGAQERPKRRNSHSAQGLKQRDEAPKRKNSSQKTRSSQAKAPDANRGKPKRDARRPGHNSSGLSQSKMKPEANQSSGEGSTHRRSRRRTHKAQGSDGQSSN